MTPAITNVDSFLNMSALPFFIPNRRADSR
jgi:hypothetical protein